MAEHRVAFLFLGELHLIPHLLPIAIALAKRPGAPVIDLHVATSVHEEILAEALERLDLSTRIAIRRVRGFVQAPPGQRTTPRLPSKPLTLVLNARRFLAADVVVVAERTSLWLPRIARRFGIGRRTHFVYNEHGAAPHANFADPRNRETARILMPSEGMAARVRASGHVDAPIAVVGYIKPDYVSQLVDRVAPPAFPESRPTIVYVPHWKRDKSSWWQIGEEVLTWFAQQQRYNLILAPHVRLPRFDPDFERKVAPFRHVPHILVDSTSYRLIDQSYLAAADLYLGDGSSQVVEFAAIRRRPVVLLNPDRHAWADDPRFSHWSMGDVVARVEDLPRALDAALAAPDRYEAVQHAYVTAMMGIVDGHASERAADEVIALLLMSSGQSAATR